LHAPPGPPPAAIPSGVAPFSPNNPYSTESAPFPPGWGYLLGSPPEGEQDGGAWQLGVGPSPSTGQSYVGTNNGEYQMAHYVPGTLLEAVTGSYGYASISADVNLVGDTDGAAVRLRCRGSFHPGQIYRYGFRVDPGPGLVRLIRYDGQTAINLTQSTTSSAVNTGTYENHLELRCSGHTITGYVNGVQVATSRTVRTPQGCWQWVSPTRRGSRRFPMRASRICWCGASRASNAACKCGRESHDAVDPGRSISISAAPGGQVGPQSPCGWRSLKVVHPAGLCIRNAVVERARNRHLHALLFRRRR